nr:hypothetical protein [Vallicoccus soli]
MTLLRHSAAGLAALALEGSLGLRIAEQMRHRTGRSPSPAEITSWDRSLPVLAQDLLRAGLDRVEVLVEHHLPLTSKRADVVLAGAHPRTGEPSYVVVELKQWSAATPWEDDPELVLVPGTARPHLHPVAQVRGYCDYLVDFTSALQDVPDAVAGLAYLHNATDEQAVSGLWAYPQDRYGRLFTAARQGELVDFLLERLDPASRGRRSRTCCSRAPWRPAASSWRSRRTRCSAVSSSSCSRSRSWRTRWSCTRSSGPAPGTARLSSS